MVSFTQNAKKIHFSLKMQLFARFLTQAANFALNCFIFSAFLSKKLKTELFVCPYEKKAMFPKFFRLSTFQI